MANPADAADPGPTSDPGDIVLPADEVDHEFNAFRRQVKSALGQVEQALVAVDAAIEAAEGSSAEIDNPESRERIAAIAKAEGSPDCREQQEMQVIDEILETHSDRKRAASSPASHALKPDRKRARDDGQALPSASQSASSQSVSSHAPDFDELKVLAQKRRLQAAERTMGHWRAQVERERCLLASCEEGRKHKLKLLSAPWVPQQGVSADEQSGPGAPILNANGVETAHYDFIGDWSNLFIKVWLNDFSASDYSLQIRSRHFCVMDATENQTIGDLKARIVERMSKEQYPPSDEEFHMFFRGTRFPDETTLATVNAGGLPLDEDCVLHACCDVISEAVEAASRQFSSLTQVNSGHVIHS